MLDARSTNEDFFQSHGEAEPEFDENAERGDRPGREPVFSVETLVEGRSAYEAVFEDATRFLRR